jgi:hypothetical protein
MPNRSARAESTPNRCRFDADARRIGIGLGGAAAEPGPSRLAITVTAAPDTRPMTHDRPPAWRLDDLLAEQAPARLVGRDLRYQLTQLVVERGPMSVAAMVAAIDELGFRLEGRQSKVISDALRWEVARGRLVRIGRGRYRLGSVPRSTAHRIAARTRMRHHRLARWIAKGRPRPLSL